MSANQSEYEGAVAEGVKFLWQTNVTEFIGNERGWLTSARLHSPEGDTVLPFNRIYLAIGSRPASRIVSSTKGIEVDEKYFLKE